MEISKDDFDDLVEEAKKELDHDERQELRDKIKRQLKEMKNSEKHHKDSLAYLEKMKDELYELFKNGRIY